MLGITVASAGTADSTCVFRDEIDTPLWLLGMGASASDSGGKQNPCAKSAGQG
ncbi:hypothetical protein [Corallococcus exiguus]|uniref:hypothetical protein n=1 Tax=Corallococcus exiguus TaxID=83462 RepID=UPI001470B537|nr:hypothetical protein [Corallococcus exiguus]NNB90824.1 hypothetical protein [Corallococcus exiguus]